MFYLILCIDVKKEKMTVNKSCFYYLKQLLLHEQIKYTQLSLKVKF
jgi:hypothetical protein